MTPRRTPDAGLTLFEMLIVMAIIGIASTAAVMGTSALTRDTRARDEATRLAALWQVAADEALVGGQALVLDWSAEGYGFRRRQDDGTGWEAPLDPRLTSARVLPAGLSLARADGAEAVATIAPGGTGPAVALRLNGAGGVWTVAFDGVRAVAHPGVASP